MTMQKTPWYQGFTDGLMGKPPAELDDEIDAVEYKEGYTEGSKIKYQIS